jgi:hypothetical protein
MAGRRYLYIRQFLKLETPVDTKTTCMKHSDGNLILDTYVHYVSGILYI